MTKPTGFAELKIDELIRSAVEDFAVEAAPSDSRKKVLAALEEAGVTWSDYVAQHPEVAPEEAVVEAKPDPNTVIRTAEPIATAPAEKYLVKMTRDNVLYETRGYRFTSAHPYALVEGEDLEYILAKEDGFRQAFPSELQEFYG